MIAALSLAILAQLYPTPASRFIQQDGSGWQISYSFRPATQPDGQPLTILPADLAVRIASPGLSNSRAMSPERTAAHGTPRPVDHSLEGYGAGSTVRLHGRPDESGRCEERASVRMWAGDGASRDDNPAAHAVTVPSGGSLNVRLTLAHAHEGPEGIDPLLGRRDVVIRIGQGPGAWTFRDTLNLDREQYLNLPDRDWRPMDSVPEDHRDTEVYFSAPYSLILDAFEPGQQYYRFGERKVRAGMKMKLKFRYLVAPGCDGEFKVRVAQYREVPNSWKVLSEDGFERTLYAPPVAGARPPTGQREPPAGTWRVFDEVFRTGVEATTLAVDVRLAQADAGLAWVDDLTVDYVGVGDGNGAKP